ncbi:MAG: 4Fe-4S double cluster binding domain-containing protein [Planctomycetota bacterium]
MNMDALWKNISDLTHVEGIEVVSTTSLRSISKLFTLETAAENLISQFKTAVVVGIPVPSASFYEIVDVPTLLYFHHYRQVNYALDRIALKIALLLEGTGFESIAIPASQIVSWQPIPRGHISHKMLGYFAGLGWRGRNNLLVHPQYGSQMRYVSVLTKAEIEREVEPVTFSCGSCDKCISVCPVGAIKENPEEFDANACSSKLREFSKLPFIGQQVCGICVKACGKNVK